MFAGATALQLGVVSSSASDRGAATALYFSIYYASGALGAYLPGLAWQAWGWSGVAAMALGAIAAASVLLAWRQLHGYGEFETGWRSPVSKRSNRNG
jgi:predicted MFS family arabinose efflux permease